MVDPTVTQVFVPRSGLSMTLAEIAAGRAWLADCAWENVEPEDFDELTDAQVIMAEDFDGFLRQPLKPAARVAYRRNRRNRPPNQIPGQLDF